MAPSAGALISKCRRATSRWPGLTLPSQYPGPAGCCEHPPGRLPPAYLLTHRVSGGTCQLILRRTCLSFQPRGCACTSRRPSSWPLCSSRWRCPGVGDAAECEDYLRVNMRIICRREALERVSDIERRRRRPGLRLLRVSGPWPNRAWTSCDNPTLCAPLSASQNKVLSCWEIAVEGCGRSRIVK
jgi:hypothetical protein